MKKNYIICGVALLILGSAFLFGKNTLAKPDFQKLYVSVIEEHSDVDSAFNELQTFAKRGEARAQFYLGAIYERDQDYPHAREWYKKAAEQNDVDALYNLGLYYEKLAKNPQEATVYYSKAVEIYQQTADKDDIIAQYQLGLAYN